MPNQTSQMVDWIERLIEEKLRLESIQSKREELLKRNIGQDLIHSSIEESKKRIALAKAELAARLQELTQK